MKRSELGFRAWLPIRMGQMVKLIEMYCRKTELFRERDR